MKIQNIIPFLILSSTLACKTPAKKVLPKIVESTQVQKNNTGNLEKIFKDTFSLSMTDTEKIIEYHKYLLKNKKQTGNYIIINKKRCTATVYNANGKILAEEEVLLGKHKGDRRNRIVSDNEVENLYTTPPGDFFISREGSRKGSKNEILYGKRLLQLEGDFNNKATSQGVIAIHQVPNSKWGKKRLARFDNFFLFDNRVSHGCINLIDTSFDKIRSLIRGIKTKVYVIPEEKNNSLYLEKQQDGSYKFFQTKYRYE